MNGNETLRQLLQPMFDHVRARSEIIEPDDSYWFHRPTRNFPPPSVVQPGEYDGGARLALAITQTDLGASKQKALVHQWCALLPTLTNVRTLWFQTKVTQPIFEAACAMPALEGLYVKWSTITSLKPLSALRRLTHLHLGGAPSAKHLDAIAKLPKLVDLEIQNTPMRNLTFLAALAPRLVALSISGEANSLKPLKLPTLKPLKTLRRLERLTLATLRVGDESLAPLAELPKLKFLGLNNMFPMPEYARLHGRRPDIECSAFVASTPMNSIPCKKCKQHTLHMLTGKGTSWLCETCDAVPLAKHATEFETLRAAAMKRGVSKRRS